jgi:hypothetical protein
MRVDTELIKRAAVAAESLAPSWGGREPGAMLHGFRLLIGITQSRIARGSGLRQSDISRLEGGSDALLSTWRRAYSAMGFDLLLLPVPRHETAELRRLADSGPPASHWRRRPRPGRWKEEAPGA